MPDTAAITFGGLSLRGATVPLCRGVSPSVFTLYMLPQNGLDTGGSLRITHGSTDITLSDCAITNAYIRKNYDKRWPIWAVHVMDRRWRWPGKTISGDYNRRTSDGTVDPATAKNPQELADLLFQALGDTADTSRIPTNTIRPRALWNNSRADLALQALCDYVACEVVLNPLTDGFEVWPLGTGAATPDLNNVLPKYRFAPRTAVPGNIEVVCGDSMFQHKLQLKNVLRNYSDNQQKLQTNWESKPSDWTVESPFSFPGQTDASKRAIEYEAAYREFRVMGQQDGSLAVPNCSETISSTDQYLLNDHLLETETDLGGFKRNLPAYVSGDYYAWTDLPNNTSDARYTGRFDLFADRRVVKFPFPIFKLSSRGAYAEPSLYLTTSYRVKSTAGDVVRIKRTGSVGGGGGTLSLRRPEIFAIYSSSTAPGAKTNTEAQAIAEADAYVSMFQQKYANPWASELTYAGLVAGTLDGNVCQAVWQWAVNRPPVTTVCENEELYTAAVDGNERRRRNQLAQLVEAR